MLQQTQVKTVLERYYGPFLEKFPTLQSLGAASLQEVLKAWEGMGYYRRAKYLHQAAKLAVPALPGTAEELRKLPGIGRNTAQAIAAFAWRQSVPVMEANVRRVLVRVFALKKPTEKKLWQCAEALLDRKNPFDYNQAMMDLGALVCVPRAPDCGLCPLSGVCAGKHDPLRYPEKAAKKKAPVRRRRIVVFSDRAGRVFVAPRTGEFLHGLYGFPEFTIRGPVKFQGETYARSALKKLGGVRQVYSHFTLEAEVVAAKIEGKESGFLAMDDLRALPLSGVDKKVMNVIRNLV